MKKLIHYILIGIMLNWNVAVFAEDDAGCEWKTFEETDTYIMENCTHPDGGYQARVRSKPVEGLDIIIVEAPKKKENPIQEFKDKVAETDKSTAKVEKIENLTNRGNFFDDPGSNPPTSHHRIFTNFQNFSKSCKILLNNYIKS